MIANDNILAWLAENVAAFSYPDLTFAQASKQAFIYNKGLLSPAYGIFFRKFSLSPFWLFVAKFVVGFSRRFCIYAP